MALLSPFNQWEFSVSGETGNSLFFSPSIFLGPLESVMMIDKRFLMQVTPKLPFCAGVQFTRNYIHAFNNVWFQKISIPPPRRVFSSLSPHPPGFSVPEGFTLFPPTPWNFQDFSTWSPLPPGNSKSTNKEISLLYFDLLRAEMKFSCGR